LCAQILYEMKLTKFIGQGVRGYLNFEINFNEDINFLIGDNGCGKTTILRLLKGLLVPSVYELCEIDFQKVEVDLIDDDNKSIAITSSYENQKLNLSISQNNKLIKKDNFSIDHLRFLKENGFEPQMFDENNNVFDIIKKKIKNPIIIYTSRLVSDQLPLYEQKVSIINGQVVNSNSKQRFSTPIERALTEIKNKVIDIVRFNTVQKNQIEYNFRTNLLSFFVNTKQPNFPTNLEEEPNRLEKYSSKLQNKSIAEFIGIDSCKMFNIVFKKAKSILKGIKSLESDSDAYQHIPQLWNDTRTNLNQCYVVIDQAEKYVKEIEKLMLPITRFQNSINTFFEKSGKKLNINEAGDIVINIDKVKKSNTIFELSSGEQQLIILLGHLVFDKYEIFIVDEPELSLHLKWQDEFVNALQEANPNAQYIMATHAPAIVGDFENKCILCKR